jgi:hypothetical protein
LGRDQVRKQTHEGAQLIHLGKEQVGPNPAFSITHSGLFYFSSRIPFFISVPHTRGEGWDPSISGSFSLEREEAQSRDKCMLGVFLFAKLMLPQ